MVYTGRQHSKNPKNAQDLPPKCLTITPTIKNPIANTSNSILQNSKLNLLNKYQTKIPSNNPIKSIEFPKVSNQTLIIGQQYDSKNKHTASQWHRNRDGVGKNRVNWWIELKTMWQTRVTTLRKRIQIFLRRKNTCRRRERYHIFRIFLVFINFCCYVKM